MPTERPQPGGEERALAFEEYQGWPNRPTWDIYTVMSSYYETYRTLEAIAVNGTPLAVKDFVTRTVVGWKQGRKTMHDDPSRILVQDFLSNGVRMVEWTPVVDTLRGERTELGEANPLTTLAYQLLSQTDWQSVVRDAGSLTDADSMLRDWLDDQCLTWLGSVEARTQRGSVGMFAETVLSTYFDAVDWERVTDRLRPK